PRRNVRMVKPNDRRRSQWNWWQVRLRAGSAIPATPMHTTGMPHSWAFSAKTIGKRPAHASNPTGVRRSKGPAGHPGVRSATGAAISLILQAERLLDPLDVF